VGPTRHWYRPFLLPPLAEQDGVFLSPCCAGTKAPPSRHSRSGRLPRYRCSAPIAARAPPPSSPLCSAMDASSPSHAVQRAVEHLLGTGASVLKRRELSEPELPRPPPPSSTAQPPAEARQHRLGAPPRLPLSSPAAALPTPAASSPSSGARRSRHDAEQPRRLPVSLSWFRSTPTGF
jgi:hypothetical protein